MSILEDVLLNARSAVDSVGKKAGKVIDMSKLIMAAADIKAELSKKYEILGRVTFEAQTKGKDYSKSVAEIVEKISQLQAELASVNEMIANSKNRPKCTNCGSYNAKGAVFCNKCGAKLVLKPLDEEKITEEDIVDFTEDNFEDDDMGI